MTRHAGPIAKIRSDAGQEIRDLLYRFELPFGHIVYHQGR